MFLKSVNLDFQKWKRKKKIKYITSMFESYDEQLFQYLFKE